MKLTSLKTLGLAAVVAASVAIPVAYASGIFQGYPIVGSAAFCSSTNSQSTSNTVPGTLPSNSNCTTTVPAGPSALTGNELVPADTNLPNGSGQETVRVPMVLAAGGAYQYAAPTAGSTVTVAANVNNLVLDPAGTLATLTVALPAASALIDGQTIHISSSQTVTALTMTAGSGTSISNSPTALTISTTTSYGYEFVYRAANTKWYRLN